MLIDANAIRTLLTMPALIQALAVAPRAAITVPDREQHQLGKGTLLVMPAWSPELIGLKTVTVFPANAARGLATVLGQYLLMSAHSGQPLAVIDGTELTLWRTAAVSALAGARLARVGSGEILVVGTGALAPYLIHAHHSAHPHAAIKVWGRNPEKAVAFAEQCRVSGAAVGVADDLEVAVRQADLVCCATSSSHPLIKGRWLKDSVHLDLVGGFTPTMREADDGAISGAAVFVDTGAAITGSGDLVEPIATGIIDASQIRTLQQLLEVERPDVHLGRTVFKAVGSADNDLIAAGHVWKTFDASEIG